MSSMYEDIRCFVSKNPIDYSIVDPIDYSNSRSDARIVDIKTYDSYTDIYFGDDLGDGIESDSPVPIMS